MRRSGFTIIEIVVSLIVLAVVMAGAYQVITVAARLRHSARNHYIAVVMANNRIERAKNFEYKDLSLLAESNVVLDEDGAGDPNGWFRRTTTVNTNFASRLTELTVTVQIRDRATKEFKTQAETVTTLLTEYVVP